ncbi:ERF family protein [uncultured Roseobacter sp.]|uniref:ERF family protein n=1 Tax=uncultured Roseobacter sp. TaxID=114847 RepID=UPI002601D331|nr:ERF family protein [uncultured Roseobacter sp.]
MNAPAKIEDKPENLLPADPMVSMIERVAMDPNLPIERLNAILDMRERQMDKEAEQVFNRDFAAAMAEMPDVPRNGKNKHTGNKYSTLDDLIRTTRPVLAQHGLSLNWQTSINQNEISVTAIVRHAMGHSISTTLSGPRDSGKQMNTLQGGGSTETYLKRYSGFSILGLSSGDEIDDDGRNADKSTIGPEQLEQIEDAIKKIGINVSVVLNAERVDALHYLPASKFGAVMDNLRVTAEKRGVKL